MDFFHLNVFTDRKMKLPNLSCMKWLPQVFVSYFISQGVPPATRVVKWHFFVNFLCLSPSSPSLLVCVSICLCEPIGPNLSSYVSGCVCAMYLPVSVFVFAVFLTQFVLFCLFVSARRPSTSSRLSICYCQSQSEFVCLPISAYICLRISEFVCLPVCAYLSTCLSSSLSICLRLYTFLLFYM